MRTYICIQGLFLRSLLLSPDVKHGLKGQCVAKVLGKALSHMCKRAELFPVLLA